MDRLFAVRKRWMTKGSSNNIPSRFGTEAARYCIILMKLLFLTLENPKPHLPISRFPQKKYRHDEETSSPRDPSPFTLFNSSHDFLSWTSSNSNSKQDLCSTTKALQCQSLGIMVINNALCQVISRFQRVAVAGSIFFGWRM